MANQMTVRQVLEATIGILENVRVPVSQIEETGTPIRMAVGNLRICIEAMDKAEAEGNGREADPE